MRQIEPGSLPKEAADEKCVVFAYFDETGTHDAPEVVVAGYLFSKDGAKLFRRLFLENVLPLLPLDKHGRRMYRTTLCVGGYDQFEPLSRPQREHIVDSMAEAIIKSVTLGVVVGIKKSEYQKAITQSPQLRELAGDEYSVCLLRCIENIAGWLDHKNLHGRIEYVFEAGCNSQTEANAIIGKIVASSELKRRYRWHDYSFREKSPEIPQLFAPDLLAWEWQRARVNAHNPKRGEWRLTLQKLTHGAPHVPQYQTATSVGIRALVNLCYGLTRTKGPLHISV
ncbi:MAG: hypothetical protein WA172_22840 [Terriglobales bacterium]